MVWIDGKVCCFQRSNVSVVVVFSDGLIVFMLRNFDGMLMRELAEKLYDLVGWVKFNRLC